MWETLTDCGGWGHRKCADMECSALQLESAHKHNAHYRQHKTRHQFFNWLNSAHSFLRSRQFLSYSWNSQHFTKPQCSSQCSKQPAKYPYTEPHQSNPWFTSYFFKKKVKVKWSRCRPGVAQSVGRGIALLFHDRGTRRGWVISSTPRPHFTPGKDPVPILQEAGWAPGPVWRGGIYRPHRDSIPDHPARSHSIYRLSYPAHIFLKDAF